MNRVLFYKMSRCANLIRSFQRVGNFALFLFVVFLTTNTGITATGEKSANAAAINQGAPLTPAPGLIPEPEPSAGTFSEKADTIEKTIDETHDLIERNILEQAIRLDDFFGNPNTENLRQTQYQLRWRNSFRIEEGGDLKFGSSIRANISLSKLNERLRLSVYGDNADELASKSLPEDPGNPGFGRTSTQSARVVNTELRYQLIQTLKTDFFLGAGVRITLPMEAFVRSRYSFMHNLSDVTLFRFSETVFLNDFEDFGETTEFSLDRQLNQKTLLRFANSGTLSREIDGFEWGSELSLIRELSPKSAITFTGGIHGNTHISSKVGNYQFLTRYRRNFLRSWLFFELEPEISWPRDDHGNYSSQFSFSFRLEVLFQGTAAGKEKKTRF